MCGAAQLRGEVGEAVHTPSIPLVPGQGGTLLLCSHPSWLPLGPD